MRSVRRAILYLLILSSLICFSSCGKTDYAAVKEYKSLFLNTDTAEDKEIKNFVIEMLVAYNDGDFDSYIEHFDRESGDQKTFVNDTKASAKLMKQSYEIKSIDTAILDTSKGNAQAGVVAVITITDVKTTEIAEQYQCDITYTMSKESGEWLITEDEIDNIDYLT